MLLIGLQHQIEIASHGERDYPHDKKDRSAFEQEEILEGELSC